MSKAVELVRQTVLAAAIGLAMLAPLAPASAADDSFLGDGVILLDRSHQDEARALAVDGDSLYVAGFEFTVGRSGWHIERRRLGDGSLVSDFGGTGSVFSPGGNHVWDMIHGDGFLYVVGQHGDDLAWRIEKRSASDGSLAGDFGEAGVVDVSFGDHVDAAKQEIAVSGPHVVVAGSGSCGWRVEKRRRDTASPIGRFGRRGAVTGGAKECSGAHAVAIRGPALYVGGAEGLLHWWLERRRVSDGRVVYRRVTHYPDEGCGPQGILDVAVTGGGVYAVGAAAGEWRVEKRTASTGSLVWAQAPSGSGSCDVARSLALNGDSIYVAGEAGWEWRIEKRRAVDGTLDASFGDRGVIAGESHRSGTAYAILVHEGHLYVAGEQSVAGPDTAWRVERRSAATGALEP